MMDVPDTTPETVALSSVEVDEDCFRVSVWCRDEEAIRKLRKEIQKAIDRHFENQRPA